MKDLATVVEKFVSEIANISNEHAVSFELFFSNDGHEIKFNYKTPKQLKDADISMKNLRGEWIKGEQNESGSE